VRDTVRIRGETDGSWQLSWGPGALEVIVRGPDGPVDALLGVSGPRTLPPVRVGADGTRVLGLDPGTWWILASSTSFGAQEQQVDLPDAPGLTTVEFVLGPVAEGLAVLLLRVRDPEGGPVAGAGVTMGRKASGTTSPSGSWLSPAVPPATVGIDLDPPASWRPGHLDVVLEDGSQERITVLPWRTGAVVVEVTDPSGAPVAARVWFEGPAETPERALGPGEKSAWELRPGEWTAWATAEGLGVARQTFTLEPNDRGRDVHLVLAAPVATLGAGSVDVAAPILFDLDRAVIRPEAMATIAEVARTLVDHPEITRLEVQGHTDDSGGSAYNQTLSERRARAVRQALIERGVEPERLVAKGYGQSRPVTPNVDAESRAANRRVEFVILERVEETP
jgi:outer membrane protein OmpA-like peptidoglycan-associated protein